MFAAPFCISIRKTAYMAIYLQAMLTILKGGSGKKASVACGIGGFMD